MTSTTSGSVSPSSGGSVNARKVKLEIPAVKKPNLEEYKSQIDAGQKGVDELHKKLDALTLRIGEFSQGNSEFQKQRNDIRKNLDTIQQQMEALEAERNRLVTQIEESSRTGRDLKSKVQGLKKSLGFKSSEEIDAKIRQIERHMMSKRLSVPEENKFISEIRSLEKSKPLVAKYANMEVDANNHSQTSVLPLRIRLDEIKEELKICQQTKKELSESFSSLMQARSKANAPIRDLSDEKDVLKRQIVEQRAQINLLRDEMFKKQREYEAYQAKHDRAQQEMRQEERKRRQLERQREDIQNQLEDIDEEAWSPELQLTNQTVMYLRKLVEKSNGTANDEDKQKEQDVLAAVEEEGMVAIKPKKDRDEEYYFKPTKKKTEKKKKVVISLDQPLVHDISSLADFSRLKVDAPLTLQDCPALLEALVLKLDAMKKEHSRTSDTTQRRKAELQAKLESLEVPKSSTKAIDVV